MDLGNYVIHFQCHLIPGPKEIIANFGPQKKEDSKEWTCKLSIGIAHQIQY